MGMREPSGGFKFQPRELVAARTQFGKSSEHATPASNVSATDMRFVSANLQHLVANAVREGLLARDEHLKGYVSRLEPSLPGMSYDRLVRILRGETLMQLADLLHWADEFEGVRTVLRRQLNTSHRPIRSQNAHQIQF